MTDQEMFDKVATHLLTQKVKAYEGSGCKYRTKDGRSCAAGCLLPESVDTSQFEGISLRPLFGAVADDGSIYAGREEALRKAFFGAAGVLPEQVGLLKSLQCVHDSSRSRDWPRDLGRLAATFGLSPAVLEPFAGEV